MLFRRYKPKYMAPEEPKPFRVHPFFLLFGSILFWELLLHGIVFEEANWRILYVILYSGIFATFFTVLTGFLPKIGNIILYWLFLVVLFLWYAAQLIYYKIFGGFISVYLIQMGGDALTSFFKETLACVAQNVWLLLLMALPLILSGVLLLIHRLSLQRRHIVWQGILAMFCVLLQCIGLWTLPIGGTGAYTIYDVYHNDNIGTELSVSSLGFLTTFRLELQGMLHSSQSDTPGNDNLGNLEDLLIGIPTIPKVPSTTAPRPTKPTTPTVTWPTGTEPTGTWPTGPVLPTNPTDPTEPTEPEVPVVTVRDQVMEIDFDSLLAQAQADGNSALTILHQYFAAQTPTKTNDFTGLFAGKNLIYLVCESFSPVVISQEMTPTLYKLYNEGIKFTNFYGSYYNVTTNGEYTACMGIFPDLSRNKNDGSFSASASNYLPFALGNIFKSQLDVDCYGYHNFTGDYYNRNKTHPNMGYSCKFMNDGMYFDYSWPSSDLKMMQQSVKDYVNQDQFHAYYMTFSGHYAYDFSTNPMARKNQAAVTDLPYSETVKAYIACHLELEKAMAYLMEELEKAGQLENTVIVMTSDHYPYGLTQSQYNELTDEPKDKAFGLYENAFICWSYGMEDPIIVDTPCCTVDILPTLLNLFGFEYDSRLLVGKDVLDPSADHIAILYNGSFITDLVKFNSSNGKVTYLVDPSLVPAGYVEAVTQIVKNRFTISTAILNNDYYRVVFADSN